MGFRCGSIKRTTLDSLDALDTLDTLGRRTLLSGGVQSAGAHVAAGRGGAEATAAPFVCVQRIERGLAPRTVELVDRAVGSDDGTM